MDVKDRLLHENILGVGRKRAVRQRIRVCAAGYGSEFQSGPISWLVD